MSYHKIISMERGSTKGSRSPMWRCVTEDEQRVNVFAHSDPAKDNSRLFRDAGYLAFMQAMHDGQTITWYEYPIAVEMTKSGQWWEVVAVGPRPEEAAPDEHEKPEPIYYANAARGQAAALFRLFWQGDAAIWDTETTGLGPRDEIIQIGIVTGGDAYSQLIRPKNLHKVYHTEQIHGIKVEQLETAPTFDEVYEEICDLIAGKVWLIYNAPFDVGMLERECIRHKRDLIHNAGVVCAMDMFSKWHGEWNDARRSFTVKTLEYAAAFTSLTNWQKHDALGDAQATYELLKEMAEKPPVGPGHYPF